uniref:Uncharacterized protein n=1 Tax=Romanomermis culicivorax TaxID=13658 RepID=A0A915IF66_ROMCU
MKYYLHAIILDIYDRFERNRLDPNNRMKYEDKVYAVYTATKTLEILISPIVRSRPITDSMFNFTKALDGQCPMDVTTVSCVAFDHENSIAQWDHQHYILQYRASTFHEIPLYAVYFKMVDSVKSDTPASTEKKLYTVMIKKNYDFDQKAFDFDQKSSYQGDPWSESGKNSGFKSFWPRICIVGSRFARIRVTLFKNNVFEH